MKEILAYTLLIATSGVLLALWIMIWLYDYAVYEPNLTIRTLETVLWALIVAIGIVGFISALKGERWHR